MDKFWIAVMFFIFGYIFKSLVSQATITYNYFKAMKHLETKFVFLVVNYIQWKTQALEVLKLTYKFTEADIAEEHKVNDDFYKKVEQKSDQIINEYIKGIKKVLPFETEYDNVEGVKRYINKVASRGD